MLSYTSTSSTSASHEKICNIMLTDFTNQLQIYVFLYLERGSVSFLGQCSVEKSMGSLQHSNLQYRILF